QRLATLSEEGEIALWSLPRPVSGAPRRLCRLWHFTDPPASVWVTDNEWCDGPLGIERLVCWRLGAQTVPFGQFEPSRRRPDKVTEALTGQPVAAEGEPPGLRFLKPASGTETNGRQIVVELAVSGPRWVTRVDLSVNGLPAQSLGTANGVAKAVVPLPAGETEARLRAVAVNDRGQVSAPAQVTVFASGYQARLGVLRVLSIGLNRYRSPGIPPLSYSVADATAMAEALAAQGKDKPYPEVERTLLCDAQANLANVAVALQALKAHARANDTVVIFLAGHGISKAGEFYFGTYDLDLERLETTALNWRDFARALRDIGTFRVLVLADTCHAGGIVGSSGEQAHVLRRVSDDTGRLVFSASRENEPSFGFAELGHGAFTQAILEALRGPGDANRDGAVSYGELTRYVSPRVAQLTEGRQHPELPLVDPDLPLDDTFAWITTP
ncbi:MAG: caspase family protein, partial [Armatimonadetes bacterium]|nr:caspase family protein [Armatimonadota bacterium]